MTAVVQPSVADLDWIGERALSKLRWRCRRGLLENDLFVERFFQRHAQSLMRATAITATSVPSPA